MMKTLLFIGAGSFMGGGVRFIVSRTLQANFSTSMPVGTMVVNIIGCFVIGLLYGLFDRGHISNNALWLFLTVGFCGGFTTFSTFMYENFSFFQAQNFFHSMFYTGLSFMLGMSAVYFGHLLIKAI